MRLSWKMAGQCLAILISSLEFYGQLVEESESKIVNPIDSFPLVMLNIKISGLPVLIIPPNYTLTDAT